MTTAYKRSKTYSESKLSKIRSRLSDIVPNEDVVICSGSFARREASENSDIDFFAVTKEPTGDQTWVEKAKEAIIDIVPIGPAEDGAFAEVEHRDEMIRNIGGNQDTNPKITRRMLFLLEGEWLHNEVGFRKARRDVLERYIASSITDHQLALFLLNDIIRYYRTMAVDYEFKTGEGVTPKPWGIRNIKLIFSRKLLYSSGLFSVAMTADRAWEQKIEILEQLFDLPVIDRMVEICGAAKMEKVLASYNRFLETLEDKTPRDHLKALTKDERQDSAFRKLKNEGHHFTRELLILFENTFDSTHPIRRAVIF
jgi:nucleotidyltransferase-like protein